MSKKKGFKKSNKIVKHHPAKKQQSFKYDAPSFKKQKGNIAYLALDSCAFIDLAKIVLHRPFSKKDERYAGHLSMLLQSNVLRSDLTRKRSGRCALFMLPSVEEELSDKDGNLYRDIQALCDSTGIVRLKVANEFQGSFQDVISHLVSQYAKKGLFLEKDRIATQKSKHTQFDSHNFEDEFTAKERTDKKHYIPSHDAKIVAEATAFNLTLISRDQHIVPKIEEKYKRDFLLSINKKHCKFETSYYAEPRRVENITDMISKGAIFPYMQNIHCLSKSNKLALYDALQNKKTNIQFLRQL